MAIARGGHGTSTTTSVTIDTTGGSGSRLYFYVTYYRGAGAAAPTSVTDNKGNGSAAQMQSTIAYSGDTNLQGAFYRWVNFAGGSTHTVTANFGAANDVQSCYLYEVTGANPSDTDVVPAGLEDTTSPYTSNVVTNTVAHAIVLAFTTSVTTEGGTETLTHGNGFTQGDAQTDATNQVTGASSYRDLSSTEASSTSTTSSLATAAGITFIAAIQEIPSGGGLSFIGGMGGGFRKPNPPGRHELRRRVFDFGRHKSGLYVPSRLAA